MWKIRLVVDAPWTIVVSLCACVDNVWSGITVFQMILPRQETPRSTIYHKRKCPLEDFFHFPLPFRVNKYKWGQAAHRQVSQNQSSYQRYKYRTSLTPRKIYNNFRPSKTVLPEVADTCVKRSYSIESKRVKLLNKLDGLAAGSHPLVPTSRPLTQGSINTERIETGKIQTTCPTGHICLHHVVLRTSKFPQCPYNAADSSPQLGLSCKAYSV